MSKSLLGDRLGKRRRQDVSRTAKAAPTATTIAMRWWEKEFIRILICFLPELFIVGYLFICIDFEILSD
jgi:hypothetical protein